MLWYYLYLIFYLFNFFNLSFDLLCHSLASLSVLNGYVARHTPF